MKMKKSHPSLIFLKISPPPSIFNLFRNFIPPSSEKMGAMLYFCSLLKRNSVTIFFHENLPYASLHPPPFSTCGVEPLTKFSKRGGLDRISIFRGGCWEGGGDFFQRGGCSFYIKNKLKSEIFNDKKSL